MLPEHLLWAIACLFGALVIGTCVRYAMLHGRPDKTSDLRFQSLRSWWALAIVLSFALLLGHLGVLLLLSVVGVLCIKETIQILGWKSVGAPSAWLAMGLVPMYTALLGCGFSTQMRSMAPLAFMIILGAFRAWLGLIEGFIRDTGAMIWSLMLFVYALSHAYFLLTLPGLPEPWAGTVGWILYLIILTEVNDISQALVGRQFGRTKIAPRTSPNKTLEGFLGGIAVTVVLAVVLAPWLTGFHRESLLAFVGTAAIAGLGIAVFGFLGDLNKSGIKRDAGIKDSGTLLPGQGGMIDRVDSLTFSAPFFFYFVQWVFFAT